MDYNQSMAGCNTKMKKESNKGLHCGNCMQNSWELESEAAMEGAWRCGSLGAYAVDICQWRYLKRSRH